MRKTLISLVILITSILHVQSIPCDGTIVCNGNVNLSVVPGCPALITYNILLFEICPTETYTVKVYEEPGGVELSNPVPSSFFDQILYVTIEDGNGNLCFSNVEITDDAPPGSCSDIATYSSVNVSAGPGCIAEITPDLVLAEIITGESYTIELFEDPAFSLVVSNPVPYEYFDQIIYVKVTNSTGNFARSQVMVEDKSAPTVIFFTDPGNLSCQDDIAALNLAGAIDDCDDEVEVDLIDIEYVCGYPGPDLVNLTYEAIDDSGNSKVSTFMATFIDFCAFTEFPADITVNCPQDIPEEPTIIVSDVFDCPRTIEINFTDISIIGDCSVSRIFTLYDEISDLTVIHTQLITVDDETPPNFTANPDSEITFTEFTENTYDPYLEVYDECGVADINIYVEYLEPDDCARPEFMVRYYMYGIDNCGNEITETKDVLVIRDGTARVRVQGRKDCNGDFVVSADVTNMVPPYTYTWYSSDPSWVILPNPDNTATITPGTGMTDITVEVDDALGCTILDTKKYTCNGRGIGRRSVDSVLSVSPNPFKNNLFIKNINGPVVAKIYTIEGKMIYNLNTIAEEGCEINLENISAGLYFLSIFQENEVRSFKIVKQE